MAQHRRTGPGDQRARARRWLASGALVFAAVGAGAAVTATTLVVTGAPAVAEAVGDCTTTAGVIVAVDFQHFGGTVERGCSADPSMGSTTGLEAMHTAGFQTVGTAEYGTAFICRITDPATGTSQPSTTPCTRTPSASAYWSYWHADAGQTTWSYSQLGVTSYEPPPGSVTLWVFGGTNVTGTSGTGRPPATLTPTALRATNVSPPGGDTTTTTTTPPPTTTTSPPSGASSSGGTGVTTPPATAGSGGTPAPAGSGRTSVSANPSGGGSSSATTSPAAATGSTTTTAPSAKGGGAPSTVEGGKGKGSGLKGGHRARDAPKIVDVDQGSARAKSASGSPLSVIVGTGVVVALAGTGGVIAWRRRRASQVR